MSEFEMAKSRRFLDAMIAVSGPDAGTDQERAKKLAFELFWFASYTPDNRSAAERLGVHEVRRWGARYRAIAVARTGWLISDVLNYAEGGAIPEKVLEAYPELTQQEWDAVVRLATLALVAFEGEHFSEEDDEDDDEEEGEGDEAE